MSGGPIVEINYEYNDEGIRTKKDIDGEVHTYTLEGSSIVSESWDNILIIYLYDESGSPVGMQYRTTSMAENTFYTFYFEKNLQGDVVAVYNENGVKVIGYTYDAWGNFTTTYYSTVGTNWYALNNPFRYRGYYYDTETGLYYLQSRYYNPQWGRFLNADSALYNSLLGYNMYLYCNNHPVNFYDPTGKNTEVLVSGWTTFMWWLMLIDGPIPIGDIIYAGGLLVVCGIAAFVGNVLTDKAEEAISDSTPNDSENDNDADDEHNKVTGRGLPGTGEPNSDTDLYDEEGLRQTRHYGPDGRAEYDIDYRHQDAHDNHKFPHRHNFDWSKKPPRGEPIDIFP